MASIHGIKHGVRGLSRVIKGPWNYINGNRVDVVDVIGVTKVTEPATGKLLSDVSVSGAKDINDAVINCASAFQLWKKVPARERGHKLLLAGQMIHDNLEDIAKLEVTDTGKPIWEARQDILSCADALEYFGCLTASIVGQHVPLSNGSFATVQKEPLGVIAGIGAWNFPMQTCVWKAAPALACGNTFVYKPSQFTPVTAITMAEIFTDVGIPNGVFNVIQGDGHTGEILCNHPMICKLSFTGSVATGMKVMSCAASDIKRVTLELGGKSPLIIFPDSDMKNAIKATMMANFLSQGQVCSNGTRVFVHRDVAIEFLDRLLPFVKSMKIGNPFHEDTTVGAAIHEGHARNILAFIESAKLEGAKVECGGDRVTLKDELSGGWYLSPAVLTNCHDRMKVVKEEIFGSVLSLLEFDTEEEVIQRANDTAFGLAGGVFTKDIQRAFRVANAIDSGTVWINAYNLYPPEVPFGGYKHSGIGRENGTAVLDAYTQSKTVYVEMGDVDGGLLCKE